MGRHSEKSDEELVAEARAALEGDLRAFDALVRRHQEWVVSNCRYITRAPDDAQDLAQEVFVKAFFGMEGFEGRSTVKTWLGRIKVNHCLNFMKKGWGKNFVSLDEPDAPPTRTPATRADPELDLQRAETRERIREVLDAMADTLRIPLVLRDFDGLSYQEIADELGIGLSAVKMRIKRAREEFRDRYVQTPEGEPSPVPAGSVEEST